MKVLKYLLIALAIVVLIFFAIGILMPEVTYSNEVTINKPVPETFEVFIDESTMSYWVPGFKRIDLIEGEPNARGSKYRLIVEDDGEDFELIETITGFERNEFFSMTIDNEVLTNEVRVTFLPLNDQTKIVALNNVKGKGAFMKSALALMKSHFIEQGDVSYQKLKNLVEQQ